MSCRPFFLAIMLIDFKMILSHVPLACIPCVDLVINVPVISTYKAVATEPSIIVPMIEDTF